MMQFVLRCLAFWAFLMPLAAGSALLRASPLPAQPRPHQQLLPRYTVTSLTSGWSSDASFAINENGWVVGQDHLRSFLWRPDAPNSTRGSSLALPGLVPDAVAAGLGIDAAGNVVGFSRDAFLRPNPVKWSGDYSQATLLGLRSGVAGGRANAVNPAGVAVGATGLDATNMHAARWNANGTLEDLGKPVGSRYAFARAINASGVIAGAAEVNGSQVAWRFENGQYDLLPLPGASTSSDVNWINGAGVVVGSANGAWWSDGETSQYLSPVPGAVATRAANGINDKGIVVGTAVTGTHGNVPVGAIWFDRNGPGYQLNSLIDQTTSAGFLVREAYAINNKGQIAAAGITPAGAYTAVLLTPTRLSPFGSSNLIASAVPEPAILVGAMMMFVAVARRRKIAL
jgi:hypothetical protein